MRETRIFFLVLVLVLVCFTLYSCKTFDASPYYCHMCNGKGTLVCNSCNGKGEITCVSCMGRGYSFHCSKCYMGIETYKEGNVIKKRKCTICKGNFERRCTSCTRGKRICYLCRGLNSRKSCSNCHGDGIEPNKYQEYKDAKAKYVQKNR